MAQRSQGGHTPVVSADEFSPRYWVWMRSRAIAFMPCREMLVDDLAWSTSKLPYCPDGQQVHQKAVSRDKVRPLMHRTSYARGARSFLCSIGYDEV
jgi:hypothetical protein